MTTARRSRGPRLALAGALAAAIVIAGIIVLSTRGSTGQPNSSAIARFDEIFVPDSPTSLLRPANLARALASARLHLGAAAPVSSVGVYPDQVSIAARHGGEGVDFSFDVSSRASISRASGFSHQRGVPLASFTAADVETLLGRIKSLTGVGLSKIGEVQFDTTSGWHVGIVRVRDLHGTPVVNLIGGVNFSALAPAGALLEIETRKPYLCAPAGAAHFLAPFEVPTGNLQQGRFTRADLQCALAAGDTIDFPHRRAPFPATP